MDAAYYSVVNELTLAAAATAMSTPPNEYDLMWAINGLITFFVYQQQQELAIKEQSSLCRAKTEYAVSVAVIQQIHLTLGSIGANIADSSWARRRLTHFVVDFVQAYY